MHPCGRTLAFSTSCGSSLGGEAFTAGSVMKGGVLNDITSFTFAEINNAANKVTKLPELPSFSAQS